MVRNQDGHCPGGGVGSETGLKGAPGGAGDTVQFVRLQQACISVGSQ